MTTPSCLGTGWVAPRSPLTAAAITKVSYAITHEGRRDIVLDWLRSRSYLIHSAIKVRISHCAKWGCADLPNQEIYILFICIDAPRQIIELINEILRIIVCIFSAALQIISKKRHRKVIDAAYNFTLLHHHVLLTDKGD